MKRLLIIIPTLVSLAGCGVASPRCETSDAPGLVEALKPREQFLLMLTAEVERTQIPGVAAARGDPAARQKLTQAVNEAFSRHAAEWERNLVASWQTLGDAEVEQVCAALQRGDQRTFGRFMQRVAPQIESRNLPVLNRAKREVLDSVW